VVDYDGSIAQLLPFDAKGWHVGSSYWKGHTDLNAHTIGIEVVNYGATPNSSNTNGIVVRPRRAGEFGTDVGAPENWHYADHPLEPGRKQYWERYTEAQLHTLDMLTALLVDHYKLREVVGHEEVAIPRGRKTDPGPAFPLAHYKAFAEHGNAGSEGNYTVLVNDLNVRGGPGTSFKIIGSLDKGTGVKVLKVEGSWALITHDGGRGYVHESFIMKN
jgi:N-acetylmuramoyl-L-alanine amidase